MAGKWISLLGTLKSSMQIGLAGVRLKNNAGALDVRNAADAAYTGVRLLGLNNQSDDVIIGGAANALTLSANSGRGAVLQIIMPAAKATDGQVLRQKAGTGSGIVELEFASAAVTDQDAKVDTTSLAFGSSSPVTMFSTGANDVINSVRVIIDTSFDAAPSLSIGVSGTASKYMASTEVDLTAAAGTIYEVYPGLPAQGIEALIATYAAGGAAAGAARIEVEYDSPS